MKSSRFALFTLGLILITAPASASLVVFDNYPIDGTHDGLSIATTGFSDSFTLSSGAIVTGIRFGAWVSTGQSITSVDWAIGGSPFSSSLGSGTASVSGTIFSSVAGTDIYDDTLDIADLLLSPSTYYLTLRNAVTTSGKALWDVNNGPGVTAYFPPGNLLSDPGPCNSFTSRTGSCAGSFQILAADAPEPASWSLFGGGMLAALFAGRLIARRAKGRAA